VYIGLGRRRRILQAAALHPAREDDITALRPPARAHAHPPRSGRWFMMGGLDRTAFVATVWSRCLYAVGLHAMIGNMKSKLIIGYAWFLAVFISIKYYSYFTLRAKLSGAVYCYRSCLFVCGCVCVFVYGSVTTITRNCVHRSSPNWVC